jgi:Ca2+-transporting ATPase
MINIYDVLVGDVLHLEPGDMIPADGIFIQGHNLKCDESSATGESDQMKKTPADEVCEQLCNEVTNNKLDPFIISGSKVLEGVGTFLVTSTGVNSNYGKLMMALNEEVRPTPLQVKLGRIADAIAYLGGSAALLLFSVLFIRFCIGLPSNPDTAAEKGLSFMHILILAITLVVVAVPKGLPHVVTLALAFATTSMLKENNLVRILRACETMGNATTICLGKTGTLTQNKMSVVAGTISKYAGFSTIGDQPAGETPAQVVATFSKPVKDLLLNSIAINSTAFECQEAGKATFVGSKTETALLTFARDFLGMTSVQEEREVVKIVQMIPFDSGRKCMGAVVKFPDGVHRLLVKGASEILLTKSTRIIADATKQLDEVELSGRDVRHLKNIINSYAERSLRTIGMVYKDLSHWPPVGAQTLEDNPSQANFDDMFNEMVWLGIVGIQDPLRPDVTEAVEQCQGAGVVVRMVTGDNLVTAQAVATQCGIFTEGGIAMEGSKFRRLTGPEMDSVIPKLQVLARSSPEDKRVLVRRLKELGETVAVTGDGTSDGPALEMADIGFAMGITATQVTKEASSIILIDDSIASIVRALMWGRAVNDGVQKFLQFQLTVNITAVLLTFVSAVASSSMESVLTAVQLLWVNLIMNTLAAIALATDPPSQVILDRKPSPRSAPLITLNMWKMIIGQTIYQLTVTFTLNFAGAKIFPGYTDDQMRTIVFNTFVWMQIFNEFNNRRLDNKFNILEGITGSWFFVVVNCFMVGGQVAIVFAGGIAFSTVRLSLEQWGVCIGVAIGCLPWAVVIRCAPDEYVGTLWKRSGLAGVFHVSERMVERIRSSSQKSGKGMSGLILIFFFRFRVSLFVFIFMVFLVFFHFHLLSTSTNHI